MVATAYIINQVVFCTTVLICLALTVLQGISGRCPLPSRHPGGQQARRGRLHNQFFVLSIPMHFIFLVLCVDPVTVNGVLTPKIINFLYFNQAALIYMTIGVVVLRALNVYVGIARTANPDVVSSFSLAVTRYAIVCTMMIGPFVSSNAVAIYYLLTEHERELGLWLLSLAFCLLFAVVVLNVFASNLRRTVDTFMTGADVAAPVAQQLAATMNRLRILQYTAIVVGGITIGFQIYFGYETVSTGEWLYADPNEFNHRAWRTCVFSYLMVLAMYIGIWYAYLPIRIGCRCCCSCCRGCPCYNRFCCGEIIACLPFSQRDALLPHDHYRQQNNHQLPNNHQQQQKALAQDAFTPNSPGRPPTHWTHTPESPKLVGGKKRAGVGVGVGGGPSGNKLGRGAAAGGAAAAGGRLPHARSNGSGQLGAEPTATTAGATGTDTAANANAAQRVKSNLGSDIRQGVFTPGSQYAYSSLLDEDHDRVDSSHASVNSRAEGLP